jgi:HAMP domain-containing protein
MARSIPPPMTTTSDIDRIKNDAVDATVVLPSGTQGTQGPNTTAPAPPAMRPPSLAVRFFVLAALLLAGTLALTVAVADWRSRQVAERTIREDLGRVPTVLQGWLASRSAAALDTVASLAREPGTRSIFAQQVDYSTRLDFATTDAPIVFGEVGTVFLFDRSSRVLARSDQPDGSGVGRPFGSVPWVASVLDTGRGATGLLLERDRLAVVAAAPVVSGEGEEAWLDGVLAATFPLDDTAAADLQRLTRGSILLVTDRAGRGEPARLELSASSGAEGAEVLASAVLEADGLVSSLVEEGETVGPLELYVAGDARLALAAPIRSSGGSVIGAAVVARTRAEEMAAFYEIRRALALAGGLMLLLALPVSFLVGRRMAQPLAQLAQGAEAIRDGRLDVELPDTRRGEEGVLARAFSAMVEELREKQALEKLVADLRSASLRRLPPPPAGGQLTQPTAADMAGHRLPEIGETFGGRYRIDGELGRGGMAVVLRARDLQLDEDVALKIIKPRVFDDETLGVASLRQEVRLARRITHANVVRVHDLVEAGGLWCLSMEMVPGTTLRDVIIARGGLELAPGVQIAKQLCRGLDAVHRTGIVHRDIKPQNIMVLPAGVVKLMDFGISGGGQHASPLDQEDQAIGTPAYMSPEQCQGAPPDHRSDLYSLGVVLWEMFAGKLPFPTRELMELVQHHLSTPAPNLAELRPDLPGSVTRVVMACLAKNPADRPSSAREVFTVLRGAG